MTTLFALTVAAPLSAGWWPVWTPGAVQLTVGEATSVHVVGKWSGLVDYGNGIHWRFRSDDVTVATAFAHMEDSSDHEVAIVAVGPGTASIREEYSTGQLGSVPWVRITSVCGVEPAAVAAVPVVRARVGERVTLSVVSPIASRTTFRWYAGVIGDDSHELDASGPELVVTPDAYGAQSYWVSAMTPCSASTVQFRVEVPRPKPRAGGR